MIIITKNETFIFRNVVSFWKTTENDIGIRLVDGSQEFIKFDSENSMNKAYEKIIDDYRWQRMSCNLQD